MKKKLTLLLCMVITCPLLCQEKSLGFHQGEDPLYHYISKVTQSKLFTYESKYRRKPLFSNDTVTSYGSVVMQKEGTGITFLQILGSDKNHGLVYINDSAWAINHWNKEIHFIGEGLDGIAGNHLSDFLPLSLFMLDSSTYHTIPPREIVFENEEAWTVTLKILEKPKDITKIRYEISIAKSDSMIRQIVEEIEFGEFNDNLYQERTMYNYTILQAITDTLLNDWLSYTVTHPDGAREIPAKKNTGMEVGKEVFLEDLTLLDINEKPFRLPAEGMAFFDLWYVGCFPCMKAAPVIESLYQEFKESINFYSVNEVDKDLARIIRFKESLGISFPVLLNREERITLKISGSSAYPAYFIMNCATGKVVWWDEGYSEDTENKIRKALESYL